MIEAVESSVWAMVDGEPVTVLPKDLFIPPDALHVLLHAFTGPLDLLYYLIKKQNLDILNIPMVLITRQYMEYIQIMEVSRLELAAEYLLMAAVLAEIKSRMLLPKTAAEHTEAEDLDPRLELVRKLQAYEAIKLAAQRLDQLPRQERDHYPVTIAVLHGAFKVSVYPEVALSALTQSMEDVLLRQHHERSHQISSEGLSVRDRMHLILQRLSKDDQKPLLWYTLFTKQEGRMGLVVTLMAILELARQDKIEIHQSQAFSSIEIMNKKPCL